MNKLRSARVEQEATLSNDGVTDESAFEDEKRVELLFNVVGVENSCCFGKV